MISFQHLSNAFSMLGHSTKLRIYRFILEKQDDQDYFPCVPTMVATELEINLATTAYSMKRLFEAGVLTRRASGKYVFYGIEQKFIDQVKEFFDESS